MAKFDLRYPFYEQTDPVKQHGYGKGEYQCYRCQSRKRTFQRDYAYRAYQSEMRDQIADPVINRAAIRDTAWALSISINPAVRTLS